MLKKILCYVIVSVFLVFMVPLENVVAANNIVEHDWDNMLGWTSSGTGTVEISPESQLHLNTTNSDVTSIYKTNISITSTYIAQTKIKIDKFGTENGFAVYNGMHRIQVYFKTDGVWVRDSGGSFVKTISWSSDTNWHTYKFVVADGIARLYFDDLDKGTWNMHASADSAKVEHWVKGTNQAEMHVDYTMVIGPELVEPFDSASGWNLSGTGTKEIAPAGQLRLKNTAGYHVKTAKTIDIPEKFTVEFRYKADAFGEDQGFVMYTGRHRLMVYFSTDGVKIVRWDGSKTKFKSWLSDTNWHTYKFEVDKGFAKVFFDDGYIDYYDIQQNSGDDKIEFFVGKTTVGEAHIDWIKVWHNSMDASTIYSYTDDFNNGDVMWMETDDLDSHSYIDNRWTVFSDGGNNVLKSDNISSTSSSMLHVFARDVSFETKFKVIASDSSTKLYLHARRNRFDSYLYVSYDFSDLKWRIAERQNETESESIKATSSAMALPTGWNTAKVVVVGTTCKLFLNGSITPTLSASVEKAGLGRVGMKVSNGVVYFDDVVYSGEGRVNKGIRELGNFGPGGSADLIKLNNKYIEHDWNNISGWTSGGTGTVEISPASQLHLNTIGSDVTRVFNTNISISSFYTIETKVKINKFGTENGFALYDGTYRLQVYFRTDGVWVRDSGGSFVKTISWSSDTNWHTYKFEIADGVVRVYFDGYNKGSWNMHAMDSADRVEYWVKGTTQAEMYVDYTIVNKYVEQPWENMLNWTSSGTGTVEISPASQLHLNTIGSDITNVFSTNISISSSYIAETKVKINKFGTENGFALYDGTYRIQVLFKADGVWVRDSGGSFVKTISWSSDTNWHTYKFEVEDGLCKLYFDGEEQGTWDVQVSTGTARAEHWVKGTTQAEMYVDYTVFSVPVLYVFSGRNLSDSLGNWESNDGGATWKWTSKSSKYNKLTTLALVLNTGEIISVEREPGQEPNTYKDKVWSSSNNGVTWSGPYYIQSEWKNRITMPGKIMQASNGRIFYPSGESGNGQEHDGGVWVYYSDDKGVTWNRAQTLFDRNTFDQNLQEGAIVEIGTNTYKIFLRSDEGYLKQSVSYDNGVTWSVPTNATMLPSSLCAFAIRKDPNTGYHYIFWEYVDSSNFPTSMQNPRNRASVAVSKDNTLTWEFLTDIDNWIANYGKENHHYNHTLNVIDGNLWLLLARNLEFSLQPAFNQMWKVQLDQQLEYNKFPGLHNIVSYK